MQKLLKKLHTLELQHKQLQRANQTLISASTSDLSRSTSSLSSSVSELDASESIAGPSTIRPSPVRPPSPSAASVQTDRTVRAVDYMKGRKALEVPGRQESRNGMGSAERGTDEKADERGANEESGSKRADEDSVGESRSTLRLDNDVSSQADRFSTWNCSRFDPLIDTRIGEVRTRRIRDASSAYRALPRYPYRW